MRDNSKNPNGINDESAFSLPEMRIDEEAIRHAFESGGISL
jgi:hypothetical protein